MKPATYQEWRESAIKLSPYLAEDGKTLHMRYKRYVTKFYSAQVTDD